MIRNSHFHRALFAFLFIQVVALSHKALAQDTLAPPRTHSLRVYLDCYSCDLDYIRTQIKYVDYVRDRAEAQVDILITSQTTGSGGNEYSVMFIGQEEFDKVSDTLKFTTRMDDVDDVIRNKLLHTLQLGLVRYIAHTPAEHQITVSCNEEKPATENVDRWDRWVFNLNLNSYLNGQQSQKFSNLYSTLSANRITEDLKVNLQLFNSYNESDFDVEDTHVKSISRSIGYNGLVVKSLDDHWSAGGFTSLYSSLYSNTKLSAAFAPAIEYDIFPYKEATSRQLTLLYTITCTHVNYNEETIYDKTSEWLTSENLVFGVITKQVWGSVAMFLRGSHYFFDFSKNVAEVTGNVSLHLVEGLSLSLNGDVAWSHNQLALAKSGLTQEEILLQQRELESQYQYYTSIGLSYSFGSIFNNIVNARFPANSYVSTY